MTVDYVVYAAGGGNGHAVRGAVLQSLLKQLGSTAQLLVHKLPSSVSPANDRIELVSSCASVLALKSLASASTKLVTDTFPAGWWGELSDRLIAGFSRRILVSRYNRLLSEQPDGELSASVARYDDILLPYPQNNSEWDCAGSARFRDAKRIGYCLRPDISHWETAGDELVVLDPEQRCSEAFLSMAARLARLADLQLSYRTTIAEHNAGRKFLLVGAGYNTFYECLQSRADIRFVPVEKRYDDQARRAELCGRAVQSPQALSHWLRESWSSAQPRVSKADCCQHLAQYL